METKLLLLELENLIERKKGLYDGYGSTFGDKESIDRFLRFIIEEVGEVSNAITRERFLLAKEECLDVAHSALMLYLVLGRSEINE